MLKRITIAAILLLACLGVWLLSRTKEEVLAVAAELAAPASTEAAPAAPARVTGPVIESSPVAAGVEARVAVSQEPADSSAAQAPPPSLFVRVTSRAGFKGPVLADVAFSLQVGERERGSGEVFEAVTDGAGTVLLELPWEPLTAAELLAGRQRFLHATPGLRGHQRRTRLKRWPDALPGQDEVLELDLVLFEGGTVRGTLLDSAGEPSAGKVEAHDTLAENEWSGRTITKAGPDGAFELHLRTPGPHVFLATGATGTAMSEPLEVDLDEPPADLVLRLVGPGVVRGQVLDRAGLPVAGLVLLVHTVEREQAWQRTSERGTAGPEVNYYMPKSARGAEVRCVQTDEQGRFLVRGLREAQFLVRAQSLVDARGDRSFSVLLTPRAVPGDGVDLALRIERPYLSVRVEDARGEAVEARSAEREMALYGRGREDWPEQATVLVQPVPDRAGSSEFTCLTQVGKRIGQSELVFELPTGVEYQVLLLARGQAVQARRVHLLPSSGRVALTFTLAEPAPAGTLELDVVNHEGVPLRRRLSVRISDPSTGVELVHRHGFYRAPGADWPARFELPAGEYDLLVESQPSVNTHHGTLMAPRKFGGYRTQLIIGADRTTVLHVQLAAPAYLTLLVAGTTTSADHRAIERRHPGQSLALYEGEGRQVAVRLRVPGGYPTDVPFARPGSSGVPFEVIHLHSSVALGSRETSQALTAGTWLLEVELPGGRRAERMIELVAGETLEVSFDLGDG